MRVFHFLLQLFTLSASSFFATFIRPTILLLLQFSPIDVGYPFLAISFPFFSFPQAAREKAEAEAAAKAAAEAAAAEEEERRNAAPPPPPGHQDASPHELQWPLTDVFVADAMHNYLELLEVGCRA